MDGDLSPDDVDVWPEDSGIWSDTDGDGYADQGLHPKSDNCPFIYGKSRYRLQGCSDVDGDFTPDIYDDDADGDGIRNEMERAASSGTILYDPYNADSTPLDSDKDTIPDVLDDDNDNWSDIDELSCMTDLLNNSSIPLDTDFDNLCDLIDDDDDNDGFNDLEDLFPLDPNENSDLDEDGIGDNSDQDRDGDNVDNDIDIFPDDSSEYVDFDGDQLGDNSDLDDDNDGWSDLEEIEAGYNPLNAQEYPLDTCLLYTSPSPRDRG